jgi:hypothetical protein
MAGSCSAMADHRTLETTDEPLACIRASAQLARLEGPRIDRRADGLDDLGHPGGAARSTL